MSPRARLSCSWGERVDLDQRGVADGGLPVLYFRRIGLGERGARLRQLRQKLVGVDARQYLALLHMIIEIDQQRVDAARDFRADIDLVARRQRAGGADRHRQRTARDGLRHEHRRLGAAEEHARHNDQGEQPQDREDPLAAAEPATCAAAKPQPGDKTCIGSRFPCGRAVVHKPQNAGAEPRNQAGSGVDCPVQMSACKVPSHGWLPENIA